MRPEILFPLFKPVTSIPRVGSRIAAAMEKAAGPRVVDLLWHLPTGIIDRRYAPKVAEAEPGAVATIIAVGVASPSAQGHATTSTATSLASAASMLAPVASRATTVTSPSPITAGTNPAPEPPAPRLEAPADIETGKGGDRGLGQPERASGSVQRPSGNHRVELPAQRRRVDRQPLLLFV